MTQIQYTCGDNTFNIVMPPHHQAHEWKNGQPGNDSISVYPRMLNSLRTTVYEGVIVRVSQHYYLRGGKIVFFPGGQLNLTDYIPVQSYYCRLILIGLDTSTNSLSILSGAESLNTAITLPQLPENVPSTWILSAVVKLMAGTTVLTDLDITDAKEYLNRYDNASYWPGPEKFNIGGNEYNSLSEANAVATSDDLIKGGEGSTTEIATVAMNSNFKGSGSAFTTIVNLTTTPIVTIGEYEFQNSLLLSDGLVNPIGISIAGSTLENVAVQVNGSGTITGIYSDGGYLAGCISSVGSGYALHCVDTSGLGTFTTLVGGTYTGDILVDSGCVLYLYGPIIDSGTITVLGSCYGWYYDGSGNLHSMGTGGANQVLQQSTLNGAVTIAALTAGQVGAPALVNPSVVDDFVSFNDTVGGQKDSGHSAATLNTGYQTNAAANKATPVDADKFPLADSAASNVLKHTLWSDIKTTLQTWLGTLLDKTKVSKIYESDAGAACLTADATGNLTGTGNNTLAVGMDYFPSADAMGLASREIYGMSGITPSSVYDDFNGGLSASWTGWAGSPFVTPTLSYTNPASVLKATFASAPSRAFLYHTNLTTKTRTFRPTIFTNNVGAHIGLRIDDGTDDNYIEFCLRYCAVNQYDWILNQRTGGGKPVITSYKTIEYPIWPLITISLFGTYWSNWVAQTYLKFNGPGGYVNGPGALSWTAARIGIVFNHVSGGASWQAYYVDWFA